VWRAILFWPPAETLFPHCAFFKYHIEEHYRTKAAALRRHQQRSPLKAMGYMAHRKNFTPSDDARILEQPVSRIGIEKLATMLRTSPGRVMRRADELGVSLAPRYHDKAVDTRAHRCTDGLVDPLLKRLKQIHGDRK
jgi:hypothetical protein